METIEFTHKGWMLFCPIKLANVDTEIPVVEPRWAVLGWLMWLAEQCAVMAIYMGAENVWPIRVTGTLDKNTD